MKIRYFKFQIFVDIPFSHDYNHRKISNEVAPKYVHGQNFQKVLLKCCKQVQKPCLQEGTRPIRGQTSRTIIMPTQKATLEVNRTPLSETVSSSLLCLDTILSKYNFLLIPEDRTLVMTKLSWIKHSLCNGLNENVAFGVLNNLVTLEYDYTLTFGYHEVASDHKTPRVHL